MRTSQTYHTLEALDKAIKHEISPDSILEPLEDRSQFPFNLRIGFREQGTGNEWWLLVRAGVLREESRRMSQK